MPAFLLPDLGEGLTEAEIVTWHVQAGDTVTVDQPIVEVETAKAVVEVPVPFAGRVTALHGQPGDVVAVGEPLVTVDTADRFAEPGVVTSPAGRIRPARAATSSSDTARPADAGAVTGPRGHRRPSRHLAPPQPLSLRRATTAFRHLRATAGCPLPRRSSGNSPGTPALTSRPSAVPDVAG